MRIYVANQGETLNHISYTYRIELGQMIAVNPHIPNPYMDITGRSVNLPSPTTPVAENQIHAAYCPPVPESDRMHNWIPITSVEQMAETDYDVIIVGTGGGAAIWRLCEQWRGSGKRIGVVERGDIMLPTHFWNIPTMNNDTPYVPKDVKQIGNQLPQFPGAKLVYALGGRTLLWGAVSPRMDISEMAGWPVTIKEMETYYNIAERAMNVTTSYTKGSSLTEILLNRLLASKFLDAVHIPIAADLESTRFGNLHSNVIFSSIIFLAKALGHRPFDLALNTRAVEVITNKGKTCGVRVMTPELKSYFLRAKTVILSASTLETTRILLHSDIQGRAIGHYLVNHSFLTATSTVATTDFPEPLGALGILIPQTETRPYQLQISGPSQYFSFQYTEKPVKDEWPLSFYGAFGKVEPRFENQISLDLAKRDEYGVPEIKVSFSYSEQDNAIIRQMYVAMQEAAMIMKVRIDNLNGLPSICLLPPGADYHEAGTCRMGKDPNTSATNEYGQIHGISGLYIADNSVLPSIGATNPTLTTVAFAIRTADYIIKQLQ